MASDVDPPEGAYENCFSHLKLPYNVKPANKDRIPYRCTIPFDGGDFLTYPQRAGWKQALPSADPFHFLMSDLHEPIESSAMEDLLQTWLFFGLLHEVLGPAEYHEASYKQSDARGEIVTLINLESDMDRWAAKMADLSEGESVLNYRHLEKCLRIVSNTMGITIPDTYTANKRFKPLVFDRGIRHSIAALADVISQYVDEYLKDPGDCNLPIAWGQFYKDAEMLEAMVGANWCRSEALIAVQNLTSLPSHHFMERLTKPQLGRDHSQCGTKSCRHLTIDDKTYQTRHIHENLPCTEVDIDVEAVGAVLDQGGIPLIRLDIDEFDVKLKVEVSEPHKLYVALSHVWADGLGNRKRNALPQCQLRYLAGSIARLRGRKLWASDNLEDRDLLFWCDTLCVPVQAQGLTDSDQNRWHRLAMQRMRQVYQNSTYTLVLDQTISTYSIRDIGMTEAAFRVITSPWTRRLWTFQEGVLPMTVVFQFADQVVDIRDIWQHHKAMRSTDIILSSLTADLIGWCIAMRRPFHSNVVMTLEVYNTWVRKLVKVRGVSVATDEAICLATLFDLEMSGLLQTKEREQRMVEFWKRIQEVPGGIPPNIIFNDLPRISTVAFRWAPLTFLAVPDSIEDDLRNVWHEGGESQKATITEHGLLIKLPGIVLKQAERQDNFIFSRAREEIMENLSHLHPNLRLNNGEWYMLSVNGTLGERGEKEVVKFGNSGKAILLTKKRFGTNDFEPDGRFAFGLLVEQTKGTQLAYGKLLNVPALSLLADFCKKILEIQNTVLDLRFWSNLWRMGQSILHNLGLLPLSPKHVRSVANLTVRRCSPPVERAWQKGYEIGQDFLRYRIPAYLSQWPTATEDDLQQIRLHIVNDISTFAEQACSRDPSLVEALILAQAGDQNTNPRKVLEGKILSVVTGLYAEIEQHFEASSEWYVD